MITALTIVLLLEVASRLILETMQQMHWLTFILLLCMGSIIPKTVSVIRLFADLCVRGQRKHIWYEWKLSEVHTEVWGEIKTEVIVIFSLYSTFAYLCKIWITLIISNHCFSMFSIHCLYKIFIFMFFPLFTFSYEDVCLKFLQH